MKKYVLYLMLSLILAGCVSSSHLGASYFTSPSRTGFILISELESTTNSSSGGGLGAIGAAVSASLVPERKYDEALRTLAPVLNPDERVKQLFTDAFSSKGKNITFIDDTLNLKTAAKFKPVKKEPGKKYFKQDLRSLKDKYQIDELVLVSVKYGLYCTYSYGIETKRYGKMYIRTNVINLTDNSIMYQGATINREQITGKWNTPPEYTLLRNGISKAIETSLSQEKAKWNYSL